MLGTYGNLIHRACSLNIVANASKTSLWIKTAASIATMTLSCIGRLAPAEYSLALGAVALGAMAVVILGIRNDMDRFVMQSGLSDTAKEDDVNVVLNSDAAQFIKWHVTLAFPGLPILAMAVSKAWVSRFQYEIIIVAGEFICKVGKQLYFKLHHRLMLICRELMSWCS